MHPKAMKTKVCVEIAKCGSLRKVCAKKGMPDRETVARWVTQDPVFAAEYARAKQIGIEDFVEETLEIADASEGDLVQTEHGPVVDREHVQRSKIRIETRQWLAERMLPKLLGPRSALDISGQLDTPPLSAVERAVRVAALLARGQPAKLAKPDSSDE